MGYYTTEPFKERGVVLKKRTVRFFSDGHRWNAHPRQTNGPANKAFHAVVLHTTAPGVPLYGYRHLSTELGRWPSRDPIGERGGVNVFGFVVNEPMSNLDLLGLKWCVIIFGVKVCFWGLPPEDDPPIDYPEPPPSDPDKPGVIEVITRALYCCGKLISESAQPSNWKDPTTWIFKPFPFDQLPNCKVFNIGESCTLRICYPGVLELIDKTE